MRNACVHYVFYFAQRRVSPCDCNFPQTGGQAYARQSPRAECARAHAAEAVRACARVHLHTRRMARRDPGILLKPAGHSNAKAFVKPVMHCRPINVTSGGPGRWKRLYDSRRNELRDIPRPGTRGRTIFRSRSISRCESDESRTIRIISRERERERERERQRGEGEREKSADKSQMQRARVCLLLFFFFFNCLYRRRCCKAL